MYQRSIDEILKSAPARITGRQVRAGRHLAGLSRLQLALTCGLSTSTVIKFEQREGEEITCLLETRVYLIDALWKSGVRLTDNEGVEIREADG